MFEKQYFGLFLGLDYDNCHICYKLLFFIAKTF